MTGGWTLVLAVLGTGLGLGLLLTWILRRAERGTLPSQSALTDLDGLEARQRDLYEQIRGAVDADEKGELELEAARNLRALELARSTLPVGRPAAPPGSRASSARAAPAPPRPSVTGRLLGAFAAGVAATVLLGWLVTSAQRDATPRADPGAQGEPASDHPEGAELSAADRERLSALRGRLEANPDDLSARKQYALALMGTGQFFGAFSQSQEILRRAPSDPDGLYVQGMVRLQMGQDEAAVALLDRVLAQYPEHVLALTAKGVALHRSGNGLGAGMLWRQAIEASGGRNPQVERLLALLEDRASEPATPEGSGAPASAASPAAPAGPSYRLRVELAAGATPPGGATLFVFLRGEAPGPPVAVRRISSPTFPLDLELTSADSMLGRPLPERGTLGARLDTDGNASTREQGDLETETPAATGSATTLRLGGS